MFPGGQDHLLARVGARPSVRGIDTPDTNMVRVTEEKGRKAILEIGACRRSARGASLLAALMIVWDDGGQHCHRYTLRMPGHTMSTPHTSHAAKADDVPRSVASHATMIAFALELGWANAVLSSDTACCPLP
jgi:hypothetical protein